MASTRAQGEELSRKMSRSFNGVRCNEKVQEQVDRVVVVLVACKQEGVWSVVAKTY